ncbi:hypothetical protein ACSSS7_007460 [Eimeria intestinalis]
MTVIAVGPGKLAKSPAASATSAAATASATAAATAAASASASSASAATAAASASASSASAAAAGATVLEGACVLVAAAPTSLIDNVTGGGAPRLCRGRALRDPDSGPLEAPIRELPHSSFESPPGGPQFFGGPPIRGPSAL